MTKVGTKAGSEVGSSTAKAPKLPEGVKSATLIVGMEIHVELATRRKVFAHAPSPAHPDFENAEPNTLIDPVTLGLPGALPVLNRRAVELSVRVGLALGCEIAQFTKWDRKNYFYPDMPKAYQISQYDLPVCGPGSYDLRDDEGDLLRTIRITRAHLEEDAGKLMHEAPGGRPIGHSIVDLNRSGAALLEIVTEPDFRSADEAALFGAQLRDLCRFLGVTEGDMQKGHMRFEPNINCALELADGRTVRTPVVEIKNLNSFRAVRESILFEHADQPRRFLEDSKEMGPGAKTTRGWDDNKNITYVQREKEDAHDYRYFPDPDLVPVQLEQAWIDEVKAGLPELPRERAARYQDEYGLGAKEARSLATERATTEYFESCVEEIRSAGVEASRAGKLAANMVLQVGFRLANEHETTVEDLGVSPVCVAQISALREENKVSSSGGDTLFEAFARGDAEKDETAEALAGRLNLLQVTDTGALETWCKAVIDDPANAKTVEDVKGGKQAAVGRLIGGVMQQSQGKADAKAVREKLLELLA